jgi:hypothetical protein
MKRMVYPIIFSFISISSIVLGQESGQRLVDARIIPRIRHLASIQTAMLYFWSSSLITSQI